MPSIHKRTPRGYLASLLYRLGAWLQNRFIIDIRLPILTNDVRILEAMKGVVTRVLRARILFGSTALSLLLDFRSHWRSCSHHERRAAFELNSSQLDTLIPMPFASFRLFHYFAAMAAITFRKTTAIALFY